MSSIDLFEALKTKFGESEARIIVKEIEKVEDAVALKVDKKFDDAKLHLATKEDLANTKNDIVKWVFAFFATIMLAIMGLYFKH